MHEWPFPRDQKEIRKILGYASYYRKLIKNDAQISAPLNILLQKKDHLNGLMNVTSQ